MNSKPGQPFPLCSMSPPAEKEKDAALGAILDRVVGLGWERGWTPKLSARCAAIKPRQTQQTKANAANRVACALLRSALALAC